MRQGTKKDREDNLARLVDLLLENFVFGTKDTNIRRGTLYTMCEYDRCHENKGPGISVHFKGKPYVFHHSCLEPFMLDYMPVSMQFTRYYPSGGKV